MPRLGYGPGRLRSASDKRRHPIWRLPNVILEPRGAFQPHEDEFLERLDWFRTVAGVLFTIALLLVFGGSPATVWHEFLSNTDGCDSFCDTNTFWGTWLTSVFVAIWVATGVLLVLGIVLGLTCEDRYRWMTVRRLWRPVLSIIGGFLLLYLSTGVVVGIGQVVPQGPAYDDVMGVVLVVVAVYMVKILHWRRRTCSAPTMSTRCSRRSPRFPSPARSRSSCSAWAGTAASTSRSRPACTCSSMSSPTSARSSSTGMSVCTWYRIADQSLVRIPPRAGPDGYAAG